MNKFREALEARDVVAGSSWLNVKDDELLVVVSVGADGDLDHDREFEGETWVRVATFPLDGKRPVTDRVAYVPFFLGQIDRGSLKKAS